MKILALESSTLIGSAALMIDGQVVGEKVSSQQKSHSEVLNQFVDELLSQSRLSLEDIDLFAVGQGPGSFTGLRIAGNIAKTFAYCFQKPMVAIDNLTLLAAAAPKNIPVFAMINAYKNMVYYGLFKSESGFPQFLQGPSVIPVKSLDQLIQEKCLIVGNGFAAFEGHFPPEILAYMERDSRVSDEASAKVLATLAMDRFQRGLTLDWKSFLPLYIRASEAEETKRGIFIPSLS